MSEGVAFEWSDVRHWLPDLAVGLACVSAGAWSLDRRRATGALLAATGVLWFLGNVSTSLLYAHRGALVHLFLTYPGWRPKTRLQLVAIVAGYVISLTRLWESELAGPIAACAVLAATVVLYVRSHGRARRDRRTALEAAAAFALAIVTGAVVRTVLSSGAAVEPMLLLYEVTIVWIAVFLAARLRPAEPAAVADLVVELGERQPGELRGALASALGDPTLEIGYWTASGVYVDEHGARMPLSAAGDDRVATFVERDGDRFAVLIHDAAVLDDPALVEAVATATRLASTNAALTNEVRERLIELAASRRRLVVATDAERRRLAVRLHAGVESRVADLRATVASIADRCAGSDAGEHVRRAADHLDQTAVDLRQVAAGLHPRELDAGLCDALRALADRSPVPVDLVIDVGDDTSGEIAAAVYFVCAEALTNIAKHAGATQARIELSRRSGRLLVAVNDDGCGGADPRSGSGLRGLTDRVEALDGALSVSNPPSGGTRLTVELPVGS